MQQSIAVLITCHNRKVKTLTCLTALMDCIVPENNLLEVFLVDDGSSDGTSHAIKTNFPQVNIIQGNGNLYWNKGMRLAWETAAKTKEYDFYLWLNDDVIVKKEGLKILIEDSKKAKNNIICGSMQSMQTKVISYGGRNKKGKLLLPDSSNKECYYINGNMVLIPKTIYETIGMLDPIFPHAIGDFDYGLRAIKKGFKSLVSSDYTGYCETNSTLPKWCLPSVSLNQRIKSLYSPLGNSHPYYFFIYENRHFGFITAIKHFLSIHLRVLFPHLWTV
jgi:GT2 family glycosyltransferase